MKYMTKEWYKNISNNYDFPTELKIIEGNRNNLEEVFITEYKNSFNDMKKYLPPNYEESVFEDIFEGRLKNVKQFFSAGTLKKVADIRLLALGKVFKSEYDFVEAEIIKKDSMQAYNKYYNTIKSRLPKDIDERLHLHDCQITNIIKENDKCIIELDCSQGFGDIKRITFKNYTIKKEEINFINRWWLYEEIYIVDNRYELHVMTNGSRQGVAYLTIQADEIILE